MPQSACINGASPSDCLVSYLGHSLGESYPSAEKQSEYSAAAEYSEQQKRLNTYFEFFFYCFQLVLTEGHLFVERKLFSGIQVVKNDIYIFALRTPGPIVFHLGCICYAW